MGEDEAWPWQEWGKIQHGEKGNPSKIVWQNQGSG